MAARHSRPARSPRATPRSSATRARTTACPRASFSGYKRQIERDARRDKNRNNNFSFAQLGINPRDWIENPKNEGTQDVGGAQTIHVSADVDVAAFVQDLDDLLGRARASACRTSSSRAS